MGRTNRGQGSQKACGNRSAYARPSLCVVYEVQRLAARQPLRPNFRCSGFDSASARKSLTPGSAPACGGAYGPSDSVPTNASGISETVFSISTKSGGCAEYSASSWSLTGPGTFPFSKSTRIISMLAAKQRIRSLAPLGRAELRFATLAAMSTNRPTSAIRAPSAHGKPRHRRNAATYAAWARSRASQNA